MPTPNGLLKSGDVLEFKADPRQPVEATMDGIRAHVVRRNGNDIGYSVVLKRVDGKDWAPSPSRLNDPKQMLMLEAHYWVFMQRGGWTLVRGAK